MDPSYDYEEIESLKLSKTWGLVDKPSYHKPIECKWFYKIKEWVTEDENPGTRLG